MNKFIRNSLLAGVILLSSVSSVQSQVSKVEKKIVRQEKIKAFPGNYLSIEVGLGQNTYFWNTKNLDLVKTIEQEGEDPLRQPIYDENVQPNQNYTVQIGLQYKNTIFTFAQAIANPKQKTVFGSTEFQTRQFEFDPDATASYFALLKKEAYVKESFSIQLGRRIPVGKGNYSIDILLGIQPLKAHTKYYEQESGVVTVINRERDERADYLSDAILLEEKTEHKLRRYGCTVRFGDQHLRLSAGYTRLEGKLPKELSPHSLTLQLTGTIPIIK